MSISERAFIAGYHAAVEGLELDAPRPLVPNHRPTCLLRSRRPGTGSSGPCMVSRVFGISASNWRRPLVS